MSKIYAVKCTCTLLSTVASVCFFMLSQYSVTAITFVLSGALYIFIFLFFFSEQIWTTDIAQASTAGENNLISMYSQVIFPVFFSLPKHITYAILFSKIIIYYRYSALGPVWAETRAQSGDWYGSGTLHPGQGLRGSLPLLPPPRLYVPTFATRCLHVLYDARDPSGGR